MLVQILGVIFATAIAFIYYSKWAYGYWKRKNVPYLEPAIPFGTMQGVYYSKMCFGELMRKQYNEGKKMGYKALGIFQLTTPNYLVIDPDHIKNLIIKDFIHFTDHGVYHNERDDPLSAHLFALEGERWRNLRVKLSPTFSSGKMKMMCPLVVAIGDHLKIAMEDIYQSKQAFEAKDLAGAFTTDVIGACGFGLDCNSFKEPNTGFRKHTKNVFKYKSWEAIKNLFAHTNPDLARFLGIRAVTQSDSDFFMSIIKQTVELRKRTNTRRKDFMQLLIDLRDNTIVNDSGEVITQDNAPSMTFEELAAQAFLFFFAGYESSSVTLTFGLYELSMQPLIQAKIKKEVDAVLIKYDGKITYESLSEMKYLEQTIEETLRMYPPLPSLHRKCTRDYKVPDTDTVIEKGTQIVMPLMGLHYDEEYYTDPYKFNPDRFSPENKRKIKPFTYLPFGDGLRICTGMRFAHMQLKIAFATMLQSYKFSLNQKTVLPIKFNPAAFFLTAIDGIWLDVERA